MWLFKIYPQINGIPALLSLDQCNNSTAIKSSCDQPLDDICFLSAHNWLLSLVFQCYCMGSPALWVLILIHIISNSSTRSEDVKDKLLMLLVGQSYDLLQMRGCPITKVLSICLLSSVFISAIQWSCSCAVHSGSCPMDYQLICLK